MKPEQMSPAELLAQLLTTDYGGIEQKRTCLIRLLRDPDLARKALKIQEEDRGGPRPLFRSPGTADPASLEAQPPSRSAAPPSKQPSRLPRPAEGREAWTVLPDPYGATSLRHQGQGGAPQSESPALPRILMTPPSEGAHLGRKTLDPGAMRRAGDEGTGTGPSCLPGLEAAHPSPRRNRCAGWFRALQPFRSETSPRPA